MKYLNNNLVFRTVGFALFGFVVWLTGKNGWLDNVVDSPASILAIALIVAGAGLMLYCIFNPSTPATVVAILLAVVGTIVATSSLPSGSGWKFGLVLIGLFGFAVWTLLGYDAKYWFYDRFRAYDDDDDDDADADQNSDSDQDPQSSDDLDTGTPPTLRIL